MIRKVPQDFLLGAALSAYQMEGAAGADGREPSVWDAWLARPGSGYDGKVASDFYHHFEEDIAAAAAHGLRALTLSLSWSRILRANGMDLIRLYLSGACLAGLPLLLLMLLELLKYVE